MIFAFIDETLYKIIMIFAFIDETLYLQHAPGANLS